MALPLTKINTFESPVNQEQLGANPVFYDGKLDQDLYPHDQDYVTVGQLPGQHLGGGMLRPDVLPDETQELPAGVPSIFNAPSRREAAQAAEAERIASIVPAANFDVRKQRFHTESDPIDLKQPLPAIPKPRTKLGKFIQNTLFGPEEDQQVGTRVHYSNVPEKPKKNIAVDSADRRLWVQGKARKISQITSRSDWY